MKKRARLVSKIVLLCSMQQGMGMLWGQQPLLFKHLTVESGLSTNSTLSIAQDSSGYLWVGTMDGLNRYDGNRVSIYRAFLQSFWQGAKRKITCLLVDRRNRLWIGTNDGIFIYQKETDSFQAFFSDKAKPSSLSQNSINELYLDRSGSVWIASDMGLDKATWKGDSLSILPVPLLIQNNIAVKKVLCIYETAGGPYLVGTNNGLVRLRYGSGKQPTQTEWVAPGYEVTTIAEDGQHRFWIGTRSSGLLKLDETCRILTSFRQGDGKNNLLSNVIRKIHLDGKGGLWIGTIKGLNILNIHTGQIGSYVHNPTDKNTLNFNSIYDIFQDRQDNIWIATFFGGLNYVEAMGTPFKVYQDGSGIKGVSSNIISSIIEDEKGNLWIGTEAEGLNKFDTGRLVFKPIKNDANHPDILSSNLVKAMLMVDREIWLGLHEGGINVISEDGKRIASFDAGSAPNSINSRHVTSLMRDHLGRIWIGHETEGINIYDPKSRTMKDFEVVFPGEKLNSKAISALFMDSDHNIWIGSWQGLSVLGRSDSRLQVILPHTPDGQQLSDFIYSIREDRQHQIWVAAYSGLYTYNKAKKQMVKFIVPNDPGNYVPVGIVPDDVNNLWVSTNNGLKLIDAARKQVYTFTIQDGLPGNVFNANSVFLDSRGLLFFGGYNGLVEFNPKNIVLNRMTPLVDFNGLQVNGKAIRVGDSTGILPVNISNIGKVSLRYDQNVIDIDYAVMNLVKPAKNRSAYLLEGFDRNWIYPESHRASFTNLPPGNYRLMIKAANNDGIWNQAPGVLEITILPPPWKTWWAYTLYALALCLLAFGIIYFISSRTALRRKIRYEQMMYEKQQELYQMKMDFFTHISHELRTPLTLIVGPLEVLNQILPGNQQVQKMLNTIGKNTERMIKLTNDLLAFRKAEAGHTQLATEEADIVAFAKTVFEKFEEEATRKSIHYNFEPLVPLLHANFDKHHMEIVLTNLLSNAFKFTDTNGEIILSVNEPQNGLVEIMVCDNGIGIPLESQEKIFTGFFQAGSVRKKDQGSGIGLAFSKRLVELHGGSLTFQSGISGSTEKMKTCFTVSIPVKASVIT